MPHPENRKLSLYDPWHGQKLLQKVEYMLKNVEIIPVKVAAFNKFSKKIEFLPEGDKIPNHIEMISGALIRSLALKGGNKMPEYIMS